MITRKRKLNSEEETGIFIGSRTKFSYPCLLLIAILLSFIHGDDEILAGEDA